MKKHLNTMRIIIAEALIKFAVSVVIPKGTDDEFVWLKYVLAAHEELMTWREK